MICLSYRACRLFVVELVHMKVSVVLVAVSALASLLQAQVTIQHGATLSQLLNNLYGGNGIQLRETGHQAHFGESRDFQQFSSALQTALQSRTLFPIPSAAGLVSYRFSEQTGTYERVQGTFGPILADRATTTGKGSVNIFANYTFSDFERVDDREEILLTLRHCLLPQCVTNIASPYLQDTIRVRMRMRLKTQALTTSVLYGVTDSLDVGVVIPYLRNDLTVFTHAEIVPGPASTPPSPHQFDIAVETPDQIGSNHAVGIGDMVVRGKMRLARKLPFDSAALVDVALPTGDKENFLGTGEVRVKATFIASHSGTRATPHLNVGYEVNAGKSDFSQFDYRLGTEVSASPRLTLAAELLGIVRPRADSILRTSALEDQQLVGRSEIDGAFGGKWEVRRNTVLTFNLVMPLNSSGLRPNSTLMFGVQFGI